MIELIENDITVDEYLKLRAKVRWRTLKRSQAELAIKNSMYFIKARDEFGNIIGMGRVVGDGAVICYIQDLVVAPEAQGKKVGTLIINKLISYVENLTDVDSRMMLCLMCAKGREPFYEKNGFMQRPTEDLGPGMIRYISK